jgi:hypothetical protein
VRRAVVLAAALTVLASACRIGTDARAPVSPAPRLLVTPESLAFHGRVGDTILPDKYLSLSLEANASGRWIGFENGSWLLIPTGGDTLPFFLPVGPRPAGVAVGLYSASIWIIAANDTVRVPVTLQLDSVVSLSGRWAASQDTLRLGLDLADSAGTVRGQGTISPPARSVVVAGVRSDTTVSLTLTASDSIFVFTGSLVGDDLLAGTLTGGGWGGVSVTLVRQ